MPKIGRNDPCACGSGKKYKQCCRDKDTKQPSAPRSPRREQRRQPTTKNAKHGSKNARHRSHEDELARASNAVIDLLDAGKIDEAEHAARELLVHFPDVHDGYDRLGMVFEARGDHKAAAHCYRKVIEFVRAHPELYDPEFEMTFQHLIAKLDPPPAAAD